jgi:hypothetical protein
LVREGREIKTEKEQRWRERAIKAENSTSQNWGIGFS